MMNILFRNDLETISRRQFLKLAESGLSSIFLLPILDKWFRSENRLFIGESKTNQGRILNNQVALYDRPTFKGKVRKLFWYDLILPITDITVGDTEPSYNRVWYQMNGEGFVHSGSVQPVEIRTNLPRRNIPPEGLLAEVTVPFTDVLWNIRHPTSVAYRFYYGTTHWVISANEDEKGKIWYRVFDDKWGFIYYGDASHFHIINPSELEPISADIPPDKKRMEIHLADQVLIAYEDNIPVCMTRIASGARFSDGDFRTRTGTYFTNRKRPSRHMAAGDLAARNSYDLPGVPWISYLTEQGVAIHGTYWHNDFGKPRSHGCINVTSNAARWIFRWTLPNVPFNVQTLDKDPGTVVQVA